jgi:hypothetical protein
MIKFETNKEILEYLQDFAPEAQLANGFNDCLVGIAEQFGGIVAVYDRDKIIEAVMEDMDEGTTEEKELSAEEHFSTNINGSYVGEQTPIYLAGLHKDV